MKKNWFQKQSIQTLLVFLISLFVFLVGLKHQEFIGFETRFALFATEMLRHGVSLFPTTYHQPYPDYPVLPTFFIYFFAHLFGGLNKLTAVLPSALASAITLTFTYLIGALHQKKWGIFAALFGFLTFTFLQEARTISMDQYPTMVACIIFYIIHSNATHHQKKYLWAIPLLLLFSFFCRGPIGLIVPASVASIYYLLDKNFKSLFIFIITTGLLLTSCIGTLLVMAYQVGGDAFVKRVISMEIIGRFSYPAPPFYFYFIKNFTAYAVTYPLTLFVILGVLSDSHQNNISKKDKQFIIKLLGWILIIMVGLSIPADKKSRYILAISPALCLICGYLLAENRLSPRLILIKKIFLSYYCPLFLFTMAILTFFVWTSSTYKNYFPHHFVTLILLTLTFSSIISYIYRKKTFVVFGCTIISFLIALIFIVEPINLSLNKESSFVRKAEKLRIQHQPVLIFYQEDPDAQPIEYLVYLNQETYPLFIHTPDQLLHLKENSYVITTQDIFNDLPINIQQQFKVVLKDSSIKQQIMIHKISLSG